MQTTHSPRRHFSQTLPFKIWHRVSDLLEQCFIRTEYGICPARCTPENQVLYHISAPVPYMLRELCSTMGLAHVVVQKEFNYYVICIFSQNINVPFHSRWHSTESPTGSCTPWKVLLTQLVIFWPLSFIRKAIPVIRERPQTMWGDFVLFWPPLAPPPHHHKSTWDFKLT